MVITVICLLPCRAVVFQFTKKAAEAWITFTRECIASRAENTGSVVTTRSPLTFVLQLAVFAIERVLAPAAEGSVVRDAVTAEGIRAGVALCDAQVLVLALLLRTVPVVVAGCVAVAGDGGARARGSLHGASHSGGGVEVPPDAEVELFGTRVLD